MFCRKCGTQLKESDKFCFNCGTPVSEKVIQEVPVKEEPKVQEVPVKEEPVQEELVKEEPVQEESFKDKFDYDDELLDLDVPESGDNDIIWEEVPTNSEVASDEKEIFEEPKDAFSELDSELPSEEIKEEPIEEKVEPAQKVVSEEEEEVQEVVEEPKERVFDSNLQSVKSTIGTPIKPKSRKKPVVKKSEPEPEQESTLEEVLEAPVEEAPVKEETLVEEAPVEEVPVKEETVVNEVTTPVDTVEEEPVIKEISHEIPEETTEDNINLDDDDISEVDGIIIKDLTVHDDEVEQEETPVDETEEVIPTNQTVVDDVVTDNVFADETQTVSDSFSEDDVVSDVFSDEIPKKQVSKQVADATVGTIPTKEEFTEEKSTKTEDHTARNVAVAAVAAGGAAVAAKEFLGKKENMAETTKKADSAVDDIFSVDETGPDVISEPVKPAKLNKNVESEKSNVLNRLRKNKTNAEVQTAADDFSSDVDDNTYKAEDIKPQTSTNNIDHKLAEKFKESEEETFDKSDEIEDKSKQAVKSEDSIHNKNKDAVDELKDYDDVDQEFNSTTSKLVTVLIVVLILIIAVILSMFLFHSL